MILSTTIWMSSGLVSIPMLIRRVDLASSGGCPKAVSTWLGLGSPEVQADPELNASPLSPRVNRSADRPSKERLMLLHKRSLGCPLSRASGTAVKTFSMSSSRNSLSRAHSSGPWFRANSLAAPKPTIPATFNVPGRRPRSCWPPIMIGGKLYTVFNKQSTNALWAINFVTGNRKQVDVHSFNVNINFPKSLSGICMKSNTMLFCQRTDIFNWV